MSDLVNLARQVGICVTGDTRFAWYDKILCVVHLKAVAALYRKQVLEEAAKVCEPIDPLKRKSAAYLLAGQEFAANIRALKDR